MAQEAKNEEHRAQPAASNYTDSGQLYYAIQDRRPTMQCEQGLI